MSTRTIDGVEFIELPGGVLLPAHLANPRGVKIVSPRDALPYLSEERTAGQERMVVLTLDAQNRVINKHVITIGLVNQSQVHPREVFRKAIEENACQILIAHNHPSGDTEPSPSDLAATRRLVEVGSMVGIPVLDHLVVGGASHQSIRENYPHYFTATWKAK